MATELGKAYVQIMPSAKGVGAATSAVLEGEMGDAGATSGVGFANKFIAIAKKMVAGAAIGKALADTVWEGAALEQSLGGVEAIFGDAAETVKKNAQDAFKTAGVSANEYMEGVTSFAASLMASTGGNAQEAADVADKAFRDMSDNANRFGTDMSSIQAAYQGFAKQNYTMLDNLKLGYGGTASEMSRLLKDAQAITGVEYNIDNLADVYTAIGVIQDKLNVTGTTANEAATTFSGSLGMMKASLKNFMGSLALGENIGPALTNLLSSVGSFAGNALRLIVNVITSIPQALMGVDWLGIAQQVFTNLKEAFGTSSEILRTDGSTIKAFIDGILQRIPSVLSAAGNVISSFVGFVLGNLPTVLKTGAEILGHMVNGIIENLPSIVGAAREMIAKFLASVASHLPEILKTGIELLGKLVAGIIQAIPKIVAAIPKVIKAAVDAFKNHDWAGTGRAIIDGIVQGISNAGHLIADTLKGLAKQAWQGVKTFLGIGSPSKVFAEQIGRWIPAGIAEGIEANAGVVTSALTDLSSATIDQNVLLSANLRNPNTIMPLNYSRAAEPAEGITINVYGSDNMSVAALAEAVERRLIAAQNRRRLAWR